MPRAVRAAALAVVGLALASAADADSLVVSPDAEGAPIAHVRVRTRDIYDPIPAGPLGPLYRAANALHVRTRTRTVREQLLFERGGAWSEAQGRETMRHLRSLDFLVPHRLEARRGDAGVEVEIETRDVWTTTPEFNLERGGGTLYGEFGLRERNLLGLGKSLAFLYAEDPVGITRRLAYADPAVFGSRMRLSYSAADGTVGASDRLQLGVPFIAEDTPYSYQVRWSRATSVITLYERAAAVADLDHRLEQTEILWGRGVRDDRIVRRLTGSFLLRDRRLGPSRVQPGAPADFEGGEENLRLRRLSADLRLWRPHFVEKRHVDRLGRIEDVDLGENLALAFGVSPRLLGGTSDETWLRLRLRSGVETPIAYGWLEGSLETRARWSPLETVRRVDGRIVSQVLPRQTLVAVVHGVSGVRVARDFQVVVGGLNGLRAYAVQALAGRRVWRINVEDRVLVRENWGEFLTIGAAAFYDAARAWGPGSGGSGWFHCAGVGLRLGLTRFSSDQVLRFDVAFPIEPTRDGAREAVFSFGSSQAF